MTEILKKNNPDWSKFWEMGRTWETAELGAKILRSGFPHFIIVNGISHVQMKD